MEGLKTYVYISPSKITALYDQIVDTDTEVSKEIGFDVKVLKAGIKRETAKRDTLTSKLNTVVAYIRKHGDVGTIDDPSEYFEGTLEMAWGPLKWGNGPSTSGPVMFVGKTEKTYVGLGGSEANIVGVSGPDSVVGWSTYPFLLSILTTTEDIDVAECDSYLKYSLTHTKKEQHQKHTNFSAAVGIRSIANDERKRPLQTLEFLARKYFSLDGLEGQKPGTYFDKHKFLLGTPLYVALGE